MANVSYNNIIESVNSGIEVAVKEHLKLTNNETELSWAPEYFINVNIVKKLKTLSASYVNLEEPMGESWEPPKGKAPEDWKPNKRYDIVVRKSNNFPYAAIEVKNRVYKVSDREIEDFKRISTAVNSKENGENVFKMGIFAFYTVFDEDYTNQTEKKENILDLYSNLEKELKRLKGRAEVDSVHLFDPTPYTHLENSVWGGGCFILSPQ
jgi:hypothetical protein